MNEAYDGKRGLIHDDVYREHMPAADQKLAVSWGFRLAGRHPAGPRVARTGSSNRWDFILPPVRPTTTPTAGTSSTPKKAKVIAYTMEWGRSRASTPFHPPYAEMRKVMREVTAGLLEFCLRAT